MAIKRSKPNFAAIRGAIDEHSANMIKGIEVKMPSELTSTPNPEAISVRTAGKAVKGALITTPNIIIPNKIKLKCFFILLP